MTNINSGTAVLRENYLPELLAFCQHEDIHLFGTEPDSWARPRGGRRRVRERKDGREQADHRLGARGSEWEWKRGRGATTSESFKPVIAVGDAKQDWGFLQHVEAKQIPLHGLLQTKRFRFCRGGRACFFVALLFGEGGNIKMRYGRFLPYFTTELNATEMHWSSSCMVL